MLKPFSWSLICFSIWTVPWKQWIMACVLYFNTYFNSTFIQTGIIPVRSPSQALDRFYQPAVYFMVLRDFIVHSALLSFCAVCITHIELLGMSSPKKASLTFPGIVGWFENLQTLYDLSSSFLSFSLQAQTLCFFQSQIDTFVLFCLNFFYLDSSHFHSCVSAWSHFSES